MWGMSGNFTFAFNYSCLCSELDGWKCGAFGLRDGGDDGGALTSAPYSMGYRLLILTARKWFFGLQLRQMRSL
jgi:hypothetical protein